MAGHRASSLPGESRTRASSLTERGGPPDARASNPGGRRPRAGRMASRGVIREAAAALFLERGYQATSMDDVAAGARVSKQTIYTHFADKQELFSDLVLGNVERMDVFLSSLADTLRGDNLGDGLRHLARDYARFVIRPEVLQLRRLVVGEAGRFPDLARTYYAQVPGRVYSTLARLFEELARRGELRIEDSDLAAQHFVWLVLGLPLDRGMFDVDQAAPSTEMLDRIADAGVRVFLSAYGR
jgi:TetR/AcrR family transcriptional repressor of mexJK operon